METAATRSHQVRRQHRHPKCPNGIGNFQVIHDYPRYLGGHNLGPVPEEDILGRMITCRTHIYEIEASQRLINLDGLELKVEGTLTSRLGNINNPPIYKDISYSVYISLPETRETIEELQKAVEATCPIYNMIKDSQPIKGMIVRVPTPKKKKELRARQSYGGPKAPLKGELAGQKRALTWLTVTLPPFLFGQMYTFQAVLETPDPFAKAVTQIRQFFAAENKKCNEQNNQNVL